jgi:hypothetical protein
VRSRNLVRLFCVAAFIIGVGLQGAGVPEAHGQGGTVGAGPPHLSATRGVPRIAPSSSGQKITGSFTPPAGDQRDGQ